MTGPGATVLLCLDYPGYRTSARVADLELAAAGVRVVELLTGRLPRATSGAGYAAELIGNHQLAAGSVEAVLGYCGSAPLAFEVVGQLGAAQQRPPRLVLLDAELSTPATILAAHRQQLGQLSASSADLADAGEVEVAQLADAPADCLRRLTAAVRAQALTELGTAGADDDEADATATILADNYAAWLCQLIAAYRSSVDATGLDLLSLWSADARRTGAAWEGHGRHEVIDCSAADLLRSSRTRRLLLSWLGSRS